MNLELVSRKKILHFKVTPSNMLIYLKCIMSPNDVQFKDIKMRKINKRVYNMTANMSTRVQQKQRAEDCTIWSK